MDISDLYRRTRIGRAFPFPSHSFSFSPLPCSMDCIDRNDKAAEVSHDVYSCQWPRLIAQFDLGVVVAAGTIHGNCVCTSEQ